MEVHTRASSFFPPGFLKYLKRLLVCAATIFFSSCEGFFQNIYDYPPTEVKEKAGQLIIDASSWDDWYYLDFKALHDSLQRSEQYHPSSAIVKYSIPTEESGGASLADSIGANGIYMYWFDVFGAGITNRTFLQFIPTREQEEPSKWSVAFHRNNVRTNGASVFETDYSQTEDLPESSSFFSEKPFVEDEWSETDVWVLRNQMLNGIIGNQGIKVNRTLSKWLTVEIPPMPPTFVLNNHIFILRLSDGTYAALQLENYQNEMGVKCILTINYIYPY